MGNTTTRLAEFLAHVEFRELPGPVIEQAKKCLLDFTGVVIAGAKEAVAAKMFNFFIHLGGTEEASVVKYGQKTSSPMAALINGSMAHGLELDDGHILAHAHPGVTTIPAALAVGEKIHSSGKDLLTAITVGYEPVIRIGDAITPSALYGRGIHTAALVGSFGAASAAGKLLHFNEKEMTYALGNCCLTPVAPFQTFKEGSMIKDLYGGWPAFVGTIAALMAKDGFTGPTKLLEGSMGFCKNVSDDYDLNKITNRLGQDWMIMGVYFKKHASCSLSHTTVDATLALAESSPIPLGQIKKVVVKTHRFASDLNEKNPETASAAKSSLPFCVALALARGRVSLDVFHPDFLQNEEILRLAEKVEVQLDMELDAIHLAHEDLRPSTVEIHLQDGKVLRETKEVAKGWAVSPLSEKELKEKFQTLVLPSLSEDRAMRIFELIEGIENLSDISPLMKELGEF